MTVHMLKCTVLALTTLAAMASAASVAAQQIAGNWVGIIEPVPGTRVPLVLHIERDDAGALRGTLDSPLQGAQDIPLAEVAVESGSLSFTVPTSGVRYRGQWDADARAWKGEWSQGGQSWPLSFTVMPPQQLAGDWQLPSTEAIEALIAARSTPRAGQGIVVGVLGPDGRRIVGGGSDSGVAVDGSTLFEIGSISKIFTALILADMANRDEVSLDDPAAKYLPAGHRMPERNGRQITLQDLSTHRSGLPRMADDMRPIADPDGPFADYTEARLLAFLDRYQLPRDIGSQWEYSNLGVGLLGYLLGRAAGSDYKTLVRERITAPLGMDDTMIGLSPPYAARLAVPHDAYMQRVRPWDLWGVLAGAGGLRSSAEDMLAFGTAVLDPNSPIAPAVKTTLAVRAPGEAPAVEQALGWQVARPEPGREVLLHGGETGGFRATLGLEPARGHAVIVFANSAAEPSTADLMFHILLGSPVAPTPPVTPAPLKRTEISLPAEDLQKFVGRYDFGPGFIIVINRDGGTLRAQREDVSDAPALQIFPEAPLAFFWKDVDAQIRFTTDASGVVTGAEFTQGELSLMGRRVGR